MKTKKTTLLAIAFALSLSAANAQSQYDYIPPTTQPSTYDHVGVKPGYTLDFHDEFDQAPGSSINSSIWTFGGPGGGTYNDWGVSQSNYLSFVGNDQPSPNTSLEIDNKKLSSPVVYAGTTYYYGSESIITKNTFGYGYYESRIKLSLGQGGWPSFWMFGSDGIPSCSGRTQTNYSEIDIFENFPSSGEARVTTENVHVAYLNATNCNTNNPGWAFGPLTYTQDIAGRYYTGLQDLKDIYHIYGFRFTPDSMIWYLDGYPVRYFLSSGTGSDAANYKRVLLKYMSVTFGVGISPNGTGNEFDNNYTDPGPLMSSMFVDYFRFYKQNPVITTTASNCISNGEQISFSANTGISTDTYLWNVVSGCTITSGRNTANATFTSTGSGPVVVQVTATDINGWTSTTTYTLPYINPAFSVNAPFCTGSSINISASCKTLPTGVGSEFQLYNVGSNGHFTGNPLQTLYSNSGVTFTYPLTQGTQYSIIHGVWDNCTGWSYTEQVITVDLTAFTYPPLICSGNGLQITATASSNSGGTDQWNLYNCDSHGNISNWTPISPSPLFGASITISTLQPGQYYMLYHGIYGGNCVNSWTASGQLIYAPSDNSDPYFSCTNTAAPGYNSIRNVAGTCTAISGTVSEYAVYNSDANGDLGTQYTNWVYTTTANYSLTFQSPNQLYYILAHGVYSSCGNWEWMGRLISDPYYTGGTGMDGPEKQNDTNSNSTIYFTQAQQDFLTQSAMNPTQVNTIASDESKFNLVVYPNPAANQCAIDFSEQITKGTIQVFSMDGKMVYSAEINNSNKYTLDVSSFASGVYAVKVISDKKIGVVRLIHL
jgi:beta-glucanase (GH16 family)